MDRTEFSRFVRARREALRPGDLHLPTGTRRRTPGLRREEVAALAGISVDYYTRLEQARGPRPSRQVLGALARALLLGAAETGHLFRLADEAPPLDAPERTVSPGVLRLLDRLDATPGMVLDAFGDVLAWNPVAAALAIDFGRVPERERNLAWLFFCTADGRSRIDPAAAPGAAGAHVAGLRGAAARYPGHPRLRELLGMLRDGSRWFADLWERNDVAAPRPARKRFQHPLVGALVLDCEILELPERGQRVVLHSAEPGTPSHEALRLLRVIGTEDFTADAV
ncbi:helix-turn-helix transcriptional regulator [Nocardiopsis trehalosi]|uniref:helix-turn-helix transcriptional regulator n=1 Tax=Nocardiopsis trehalosi TaxID=109329 RepID=UPI0008359AFC|nr:helix-turn-helix transcriptional regulator [Nocardiopsis trehalosi]